MFHTKAFQHLRTSIVALSVLAFVSCADDGDTAADSSDTTTAQSTDTASASTAATAEAVINGTQADTSVTGTARFTEDNGNLELDTDLWTISGSDTAKNILTKAVIVHGGKDDFTTQPTGNAGSRIGCGVITRK